jgi:beta-N-acetylhexosaminidase
MKVEDLTRLPIQKKIGQMFFVGISGPELDEATLSLLRRIRPGGVCLFARNIREAVQTRSLLEEVKGESEVIPFLSLDQEGGLVDRLRRVVTPMPAANKVRTIKQAQQFGSLIAEIIRILGFNMDFAPVVDVIDECRASLSNGLHSRAFGLAPDEAAQLSGAFLGALESGGVLGCLKHFPGLGASQVDSHEGLPPVPISEKELESVDLLPYRRLLNGRFSVPVMVAHATYPQLRLQERDRNGKLLPSSLSFNIVSKLLRQELGFEGMVLTDDLEMGAIVKNFGIGEACKMAVLAGEDMVTICASPEAIIEGCEAIAAAVEDGSIPESRIDESLARIASLKSKLSEPLPFDSDRLNTLSREMADFAASLN